jgi:hypothetical protein
VGHLGRKGVGDLLSAPATVSGIGVHGVRGPGALISGEVTLHTRGRVRLRLRRPPYGAITVEINLNVGPPTGVT